MTYTSTIPGGFLERLAAYEKADEDKRERKAARRKQLYTTFKQEVLTPIGNVASKYPAQTAGAVVGGLLTGGLGGIVAGAIIGGTAKPVGRGLYKTGKYVVDTYTGNEQFLSLDEKVTGVTREQRAQARTVADQAARDAQNELKQEEAKYARTIKPEKILLKERKKTLKQDLKAGRIDKVRYEQELAAFKESYAITERATRAAAGGLDEKEKTYNTTRAAAGGFFQRYILDPQSNARRYKSMEALSEKLNAAGLEVTPLQIHALFAGYKDKYKDFAKPGKDEKFREEPVLDKTGAPVNGPDGKPLTMKFKTAEDWIKFQIELLNMEIRKDEMKMKWEQMKNMSFGFGGAGAPAGTAAPGAGKADQEEMFKKMMMYQMMRDLFK